MLDELANRCGLLGLSGVSGDVRDLEEAAAAGHARASLALDVFVAEIRRYLGGLLVELGGLDALVFTGGIGENSTLVRAGVCADLQAFGIVLDPRPMPSPDRRLPAGSRGSAHPAARSRSGSCRPTKS